VLNKPPIGIHGNAPSSGTNQNMFNDVRKADITDGHFSNTHDTGSYGNAPSSGVTHQAMFNRATDVTATDGNFSNIGGTRSNSYDHDTGTYEDAPCPSGVVSQSMFDGATDVDASYSDFSNIGGNQSNFYDDTDIPAVAGHHSSIGSRSNGYNHPAEARAHRSVAGHGAGRMSKSSPPISQSMFNGASGIVIKHGQFSNVGGDRLNVYRDGGPPTAHSNANDAARASLANSTYPGVRNNGYPPVHGRHDNVAGSQLNIYRDARNPARASGPRRFR
jgi:hypothetical protein